MFFSWKGFDLLCQLLNQNYLLVQSISQPRGTFPVLFPPTPCMAAATIPDMVDVLTDDIGESHWWCSVYIVLVICSCINLVMTCVLLVLICSRSILLSVVLWSDQPVISHARIKGWCDNQELKCIICQTNNACYIWMILSRLNYFLSRIFQCFCRMSLMRWFKHKSHGRLLMFCTLSKLGFIIAL